MLTLSQLGGHENHRNFYCIFNVYPSNIPCNRSIETESNFTVLKFTDASNFNFSEGIVIPANSVALAYFNTKLTTKISTTLSSLSDYIRFRNLTSQFDKQDFLNWLHTRRDTTVHTPPSHITGNEWNWEENTHQSVNSNAAPSATPHFLVLNLKLRHYLILPHIRIVLLNHLPNLLLNLRQKNH